MIGPLYWRTTDALFAGDVEQNVSNHLARFELIGPSNRRAPWRIDGSGPYGAHRVGRQFCPGYALARMPQKSGFSATGVR
jgi:hypothetical protein